MGRRAVYTAGLPLYNQSVDTHDWPTADRGAFAVASLLAPSDEKAYWLSKTPGERLAALELMRQIVYGYDPVVTRLQGILELAQRPPR
jgi:hypothetical protein